MRIQYALIVMALLSSGCAVVEYHSSGLGKRVSKGEIVSLSTFDYVVPDTYFRVRALDDELVVQEDFGVGIGRGRVLVVRPGPIESSDDLMRDLRTFGETPARILDEGQLIETKSGEWRGTLVEYHLIEVPEISRSILPNSKIVDRERAWVIGMVLAKPGKRFWISLTSNDDLIDSSAGLSEKNIALLKRFAEGIIFKS